MEPEQMIKNMYNEALTAADLKAICKNRKFSSNEVSSPMHFENVFFSDKGVISALGGLTKRDIVLLHILNLIDHNVDVTFFESAYGDPDKIRKRNEWYYESFHSQYKEVFKKVRASLVRKGLLLMALEEDYWNNTTKLERWQFRFPKSFGQFLPSPFEAVAHFDAADVAKEGLQKSIRRAKIKQVVTREKIQIPGERTGYDVHISKGKLNIGGHEFRKTSLEKWQMNSWADSIRKKDCNLENLKVHDVIIYAFSVLKPQEWILPDELSAFWKILYPDGKIPNNLAICENGWKCGCLAKHSAGGKTFYRFAEIEDDNNVRPESYLTIDGTQPVKIISDNIPITALDVLAQISNMAVEKKEFRITPDKIGIGNAPLEIRRHPITLWLKENSQHFRKALIEVDNLWGKHIVHKNLLLARITDLALLVKIQKSFPDQKMIVTLPNNYIAFPRTMLPKLENIVKGSGYAVRTVTEDKYSARGDD